MELCEHVFFQELLLQIDVIFPRPKPPVTETANESSDSNQSADDEKKDGGS